MKRTIVKIGLLVLVLTVSSCKELQEVAAQLPELVQEKGLTNAQIGSGLKEALDKGVQEQVVKLTQKDGFYNNQAVKILLPAELQKVDKTLRDFGLSSLADQGLKILNAAASDAVKEATPIFVDAIKQMSFADAKNILLGDDRAATSYLEGKTSASLKAKFTPVVKSSFDKVGANKIWETIISKYNSIPLTTDVNPDLTAYVTEKALDGVFVMVSVEEKDIRNDLNARTSDLLKKVFALQDN